ncbi:hypothetical protein PIB30_005314 [Stylosanthes scabra]|uniref:BHLH domain-containing protein n=1 Tax=Stylosanthes scabra TaxID=79078 RepID=A0ABU6V238_9FABA|nr:hypothetical protein [Stylosanthes scabra]
MISTDESWTTWLCDLEEDDYAFMNRLANDNAITVAPNNNSNSNSQTSFSTDSNNDDERPLKALKTITTPPTPTNKDSSYLFSFNNNNPSMSTDSHATNKKQPRRSSNQRRTASAGRSPQHAHDHIIAERMRREKISQQFIALSALIPGLKKMDKATVLGDAIKYVKQLQDQVKILENERKRKNAECAVYVVEKSEVCGEEDVSSDTSSNNSSGGVGDGNSVSRSVLPEVEARVSQKNVLIRIHTEQHKGLLMHILTLIEKLHLSVLNTTSLPFGTSIVDITITAEMDDKFSLGVKELARNIRVGLLQLM